MSTTMGTGQATQYGCSPFFGQRRTVMAPTPQCVAAVIVDSKGTRMRCIRRARFGGYCWQHRTILDRT